MKAPVGLLSDRTVLRSKMEGPRPDKCALTFLAVPAGKDGRVERPCQTFDGFIGIGGSVCGLFLFVQTHTPLTIRRQFSMIVPDASFLYESRKFICYGIMGGTVTNNENQLFS